MLTRSKDYQGFRRSMATLSSSSLPTKFLLGFRRSNAGAKIPAISISGIGAKSPFHLRFRYENALTSQIRQRLSTLFATNTNLLGGDSLRDQATESEASQGPPFLTILAGFVVFLLIFWILKSIVIRLIGLIANLSQSK